MLKNIFEITGGLPILVWETEGAASREEMYFQNLSETLKKDLKGGQTPSRPDRLDGSDCPDVSWVDKNK